MRKLVTIRTITALDPIDGADAIEVATVDGWKVVTGKNTYKVGDSCFFLEIDSFLPIDERFEFLRKSSLKTNALGVEGFRLRTIKLRGQISQGLLMPLSDFPEVQGHEDEDLTALLGVTKWEPPIPAQLAGEVSGPVPGFIKKTDQERIQNLPEYFEDFKDEEFEATIKIDGSSGTYYLHEGHFGVCGHNWEYREDAKNSFWTVARRANVEEALRKLGRSLAIQGELFGEGIQGNPEKIKGQDFAVFDIWDIEAGRYLTSEERRVVMNELSGLGLTLKHVPILKLNIKPFIEYPTMEAILEAAEGPSMNSQVKREGLVYKSVNVIKGQTVSFKTIANSYLLKEK